MSKKTLLEKTKELTVPRRNYMKTKQELKKAIKENIIKCKEIIYGVGSPVSIKYFDKLQKQQVANKKCMIKSSRIIL